MSVHPLSEPGRTMIGKVDDQTTAALRRITPEQLLHPGTSCQAKNT